MTAEVSLERYPLLRGIVERLKTALNPARIYLFGLRARAAAESPSSQQAQEGPVIAREVKAVALARLLEEVRP